MHAKVKRIAGQRWGSVVGITLGMTVLAALAVADESTKQAVAQQAQTSASTARISSEEFISSPFSDFFKVGNYPSALDALEALAKQYPDDPLVRRYQAIVLDRLTRYDEALAIYQELLVQDPTNVPTRFFRAQTYFRKGEKDKAIEDWKWVEQHSPSKEYRQWSQELQRQLDVRATRPVELRKFYLFGNVGWEYDSNVIVQSNDNGLTTAGDQNTGRFPLNLGVGYRLIQKPDHRFDIIYTARQSLNEGAFDEFNFTSQELALDFKKRMGVWDRDVTFGSRYEFRSGFLDGHLFSLDNDWLLSADVRLAPRARSFFYNRFTVSNYGPDGSNPPQTSRDGFYYDAGLTQYFYSADFRQYVFVGEELNLGKTRGANFSHLGTLTRIGAHTPVPYVPKTDFDISAGFRWAHYPRFTSLSSLDTARRLDNNWDLYTALTYRITPRLSTRVFYRYTNANNRNDFFQYGRHIGGIQLLFTQYF